LKYAGLISQAEMIELYAEYRDSGKAPEQWLEQQEIS
jgi:hypothetical protein